MDILNWNAYTEGYRNFYQGSPAGLPYHPAQLFILRRIIWLVTKKLNVKKNWIAGDNDGKSASNNAFARPRLRRNKAMVERIEANNL